MSVKKTTGYIVNGKYVKADVVDKDVKQPREHSGHRQYVRDRMREDYSRDLVQPWTPEFVDAFPDKAKQLGMVPRGEE